MKMLCIIGLMVILAFIFLAAMPLLFAVMGPNRDRFEDYYTLGLISTMIIVIAIISTVIVNFYFTPELFGYQEIVSENYVESEE